MAKYKVIRYTKSGRRKVVYKNLSLAEAQLICSDPNTKGHNWFYGYTQQ